MKRGSMPSFISHTDSLESPPAPVDPNGEPLSERMASGSPTSLKTFVSAAFAPSCVGRVMRMPTRKRLAVSDIVSGSTRVPSSVRNQP